MMKYLVADSWIQFMSLVAPTLFFCFFVFVRLFILLSKTEQKEIVRMGKNMKYNQNFKKRNVEDPQLYIQLSAWRG